MKPSSMLTSKRNPTRGTCNTICPIGQAGQQCQPDVLFLLIDMVGTYGNWEELSHLFSSDMNGLKYNCFKS